MNRLNRSQTAPQARLAAPNRRWPKKYAAHSTRGHAREQSFVSSSGIRKLRWGHARLVGAGPGHQAQRHPRGAETWTPPPGPLCSDNMQVPIGEPKNPLTEGRRGATRWEGV